MNKKYNPWPIGPVPKEIQRPELKDLENTIGRRLKDPREAVSMFEEMVADYAGAKYGVATDCCSNALFLSFKFLNTANKTVTFPARTYCSAPMAAMHAGYKVQFRDYDWSGAYQVEPTRVWDSAVRFTKGMYKPDTLWCLSFQFKKRLPIGRGGMILTDSREARDWLRMAAYDGRDLDIPYDEDKMEFPGWHMYMTPEDAARGILLLNHIGCVPHEDVCSQNDYHDLRDLPVFSVK